MRTARSYQRLNLPASRPGNKRQSAAIPDHGEGQRIASSPAADLICITLHVEIAMRPRADRLQKVAAIQVFF